MRCRQALITQQEEVAEVIKAAAPDLAAGIEEAMEALRAESGQEEQDWMIEEFTARSQASSCCGDSGRSGPGQEAD